MHTIYKIRNIVLAGLVVQCSCTSSNITKYYYKNQHTLDNIQVLYNKQYVEKPFSIEFTNKKFDKISIEIITDSLKYIYEFGLNEVRMSDTLIKYKLNSQSISSLILQMKSIKCIWINKLDYYVEDNKHLLVFMSINPKPFYLPFTDKKYYIITYFNQPQYYDASGQLLNHRRLKNLRKINEEIFKRINDKVAYTISDRYR